MARPITWQDVQAPQQGAALLASQNAGEAITKALSGIADVGTGWRDERRAEATRQAVAGIQNAADPVAAAAQVQQGWQIDPLAVASTANARSQQLLQNRAAETNIKANEASTLASQEQVKDRVAERDAATLASPMIDQIMKTGKLPSIDLKDEKWATAAGNKAYKEILDFHHQYVSDKNAASSLFYQRQAYLQNKAKDDLFSFAAEMGGSAEGQLADPATWTRTLTQKAKKLGTSVANVNQALQIAQQGSAINAPQDKELDTKVPDADFTYREGLANITARQNDLESQRRATLAAPIDPSKQNSPSLLQLTEVAQGPAFKDGAPALDAAEVAKATGIKLGEAQERIQRIQAKYPGILHAQAAEIALDTQDRWNTFFSNPASAPEAVAKAKLYQEFNKLGGAEGVAAKAKEATAKFDIELSKLPTITRQLSGAARSGVAVPTDVNKIVKNFRNAQNQNIAEQAIADLQPVLQANRRAANAKQAQKDIAEALAGGFNY